MSSSIGVVSMRESSWLQKPCYSKELCLSNYLNGFDLRGRAATDNLRSIPRLQQLRVPAAPRRRLRPLQVTSIRRRNTTPS